MSYEAWGEPDDSPFEAAIEAGWIDPTDISKALVDVMNERDRQHNVEGWTPAHDDEHTDRQLAKAGVSYARFAALTDEHRALEVERKTIPFAWPFSAAWWKPKDRRADLVRAAALLIAEIERMDRAEGKP